MSIYDTLNTEQREAVFHRRTCTYSGGASSGKDKGFLHT